MAPNTDALPISPDSRAWWLPSVSIHDTLIKFYNTHITPLTMDISLRKLTRPAFQQILAHPFGIQHFAEENHITTHNGYLTLRRTDSAPFILCTHCSTLVQTQGTAHPDPTLFVGGHHAVFTREYMYIINNLRRLWCAKCKVNLFTWTSTEECLYYSNFHIPPQQSVLF